MDIPPTEERQEYYKSEQWKMIRDLCFQMNGYICQKCGAIGMQVGGEKVLHAHHLTYIRFGFEELEDLKCLCKRCHMLIHRMEKGEESERKIRKS